MITLALFEMSHDLSLVFIACIKYAEYFLHIVV